MAVIAGEMRTYKILCSRPGCCNITIRSKKRKYSVCLECREEENRRAALLRYRRIKGRILIGKRIKK